MSLSRVATADELEKLTRPGTRLELVKGELRSTSPAGFEHRFITMRIARPLDQFVTDHRLGVVVGAETGFKIATDPDTVRAPDAAFVRQERFAQTGYPKTFWPGAPDLAVEVVSPGDTVDEVDEKVAGWLDAGTQIVWVVKPRNRTVTIYQAPDAPTVLTVDDELDDGALLPGFRRRIADVFAV